MEKQTDSTPIKTTAHLESLLAEVQEDLIDLAYIKNYNNPEKSMMEQSLDVINSTQATNIQTTYLIVQDNMDHMLISEESLEKITFRNPQISTDLGIQLTQSSPNQLRVIETPIPKIK